MADTSEFWINSGNGVFQFEKKINKRPPSDKPNKLFLIRFSKISDGIIVL